MIITEIQYFFSKIIRFQAIFKDTVEFTCALEFKISSQQAEKLNNGNRKSGSCEAGFFYRRIGGTVYKIRVLTSENSTDTFSDKISHIISREVLTEKADYDKIELPQMSQLPEGSSA